MQPNDTGKYGTIWHMDVRILRDNSSDKRRDYMGFVEAPIEEIKLLRIWCDQVLEGAYPRNAEGFATLLMDLDIPRSRDSKAFLVGNMHPGSSRWGSQPSNISLPHEHHAFE